MGLRSIHNQRLAMAMAMEMEMEMEMMTSTLNPDAPMFVPMAYRTVEDYSEQWWALVQSSPSFRDYWLRECFQDPQIADLDLDLLAIDALFDSFSPNQEDRVVEKNGCGDLVSGVKWRKGRSTAAPARHVEKAPKIVYAKLSPRTIQQPR